MGAVLHTLTGLFRTTLLHINHARGPRNHRRRLDRASARRCQDLKTVERFIVVARRRVRT